MLLLCKITDHPIVWLPCLLIFNSLHYYFYSFGNQMRNFQKVPILFIVLLAEIRKNALNLHHFCKFSFVAMET